MSDIKEKISLHLEVEESIKAIKKTGFNVVQAITLVRLSEAISAATKLYPEYSDRTEIYNRALENTYGEEYLALKTR